MATYTAVRKPTPRIEGVAKVTGETLYTSDLKLPGMLYCKVLRSPYAHAWIRRIDASRARAYPGVEAVFTARDIPDLPKETPTRAHAVLAWDEVVFYGQPVAAVLAEDTSVAEEALDLIQVEYEELPAIMDPLVAMRDDSTLVRSVMGTVDRSEEAAHATVTYATLQAAAEVPANTNVTQRMVFTRGDVEKGFAEADVIVERSYRASWVHQGYIEPQAAIADCDISGQFTIWTSTQGQFMTRSQLSNILGVPETKINVIGMEVGGAFGAKVQPFNAALCAFLAREVRRPVKLVMSRSDDLKAANPAPQAIFELKTGAKKDGTVTAIKARAIYDCGAFPGAPLMQGCTFLGGYYKWPNLDIEGLEVMTNRANVGALRAPGVPQATFAIESQMDIMAKELGIDPLELRLKNAVEEGDLMPNGRAYPRIGLKECLQEIEGSNFWKNRHQKGPNQGVGIAVGGWLGGMQPATATVVLNSDGTITVITGVNDITGVNTSFQQIAAEVLGVPLAKVQVRNGDTNTASYAGVSGGSKTLRTVGHSVEEAAWDALKQMFQVAAERLECSPDDLEAAEGAVRVKGSPQKAITFEVMATMTIGFGTTYAPIVGRAGTGAMKQAPGFVCQGVKVEVDPDTGEITILDVVGAQDVGFAINPLSVEGQIQGALSQALGIGFSEEMQWNEKGILLNPGFLDYRVPTALDLPKVQTFIVEIPTDEGPFGAKGVGEPPITAGAAALANAVTDAVGARIYQLPVTPQRVTEALNRLG